MYNNYGMISRTFGPGSFDSLGFGIQLADSHCTLADLDTVDMDKLDKRHLGLAGIHFGQIDMIVLVDMAALDSIRAAVALEHAR